MEYYLTMSIREITVLPTVVLIDSAVLMNFNILDPLKSWLVISLCANDSRNKPTNKLPVNIGGLRCSSYVVRSFQDHFYRVNRHYSTFTVVIQPVLSSHFMYLLDFYVWIYLCLTQPTLFFFADGCFCFQVSYPCWHRNFKSFLIILSIKFR